MTAKSVRVGNFEIGNDLPLTIIGGLNVLEDYDLAAREIPCRPSVPGGGRMHGLAVGAAYRPPGPSHLYCDISVQPRAPLHCTPFPGIPQGGGLPPL